MMMSRQKPPRRASLRGRRRRWWRWRRRRRARPIRCRREENWKSGGDRGGTRPLRRGRKRAIGERGGGEGEQESGNAVEAARVERSCSWRNMSPTDCPYHHCFVSSLLRSAFRLLPSSLAIGVASWPFGIGSCFVRLCSFMAMVYLLLVRALPSTLQCEGGNAWSV